MRITALVLLALLTGSIHTVRSNCIPWEQPQKPDTSSSQIVQINNSHIKITIATGGIPYRPPQATYHVGESIPLVITMTNTGTAPVYVCASGPIYQNQPQLLRNGEPVPYTSFRQSMIQTTAKDQTCHRENLPQQILLPPNEPTVVDWFNLVQGTTSLYDDGWYDTLQPGKYTLTNQRRLTCCDGAFVVSNTIDFVVVP
jgi:hypothetical protein